MPWIFERKYEVEDEPMGVGGMGRVYKAKHLLLKQEVALKIIDRATAERMGLMHRFELEIHSTARIKHPNIVGLVDCGVTDESLYIAMELVLGETLRVILRRARKAGKRIDVWTALYMMAQVARAMVAAHKIGIVHRDLKPENVMVAHGGLVRVVDFGLAKQVGPADKDTKASGVTSPGNAPGTPRYMAPEQILGGPIDGRTDVYAIGIILYELIAGCTPYSTYEDGLASPTELMANHIHATARPITELVDCPERVWWIIQRCIAKQPKDRFQSAAELAAELRSAIREIPRPEPEQQQAAVEPGDDLRETAPQPRPSQEEGPEPEKPRATEPMPADFKPVPPLPFGLPALGPRGTTRMARPEIPWPKAAVVPEAKLPHAAVTTSQTGTPNLPHAPASPEKVAVPVSFARPRAALESPSARRRPPAPTKGRTAPVPPEEPVPFYVVGVIGAALGILGLLVFLLVRPPPAARSALASEPPVVVTIAPVLSAAPTSTASITFAIASEPAPSTAQPSATVAPARKSARGALPAPSAPHRSSQPFAAPE